MLNKDILKKIDNITDPNVRKDWKLNLLTKIHKVKNRKIRSDFLTFVKYIWPDFIEGNHHQTISDKFNLAFLLTFGSANLFIFLNFFNCSLSSII